VDWNVIERDKHNSVRSALFAAAVLLASLTCAKVAQCVIEPKRVEGIVAYATARHELDPNEVQPYLDEPKGSAAAVKENNLFVKAPPKQHPVKQVDGILGREVLIGNKWYKVGDKIGEAKVISVASTEVTIEWNGQTKIFAPLASAKSKPIADPKRPAEKPKKVKAEASASPAKAAVKEVTATETAVEDNPLAWLGVTLSPAAQAKFLEMWNNWPEEQKQKVKDEWNGMSDDEKQEAVTSFEQGVETAP